MMETFATYYLPLILFIVVTTGTPGPNNLMILNSGLNFGISRSIPHWVGICTGVPVMILAVGLGLEKVFHQFPAAFLVLKSAGISYLLYMTYKIATSGGRLGSKSTLQPMSYVQGALFQWVNPKAWVMVLSAISAFTSPSEPLLQQIMILAAMFLVLGHICVGCWLFAGYQLQQLLSKDAYRVVFNRVMAGLLLLSILPMAFVRHL